MRGRHRLGRLTGTAVAVLGAALIGPAGVTPVSAADTVAAPAAATGVTVRIDPSYQLPEFQGWGTSLVWMANATGGYPDEIRKKLVDLLFGRDGLRLTIARYNIGGGNAPTVRKDYMKLGATMPGFWKAPQPYGPDDKEWWDPDNPDHWDWTADANQRWWVDQIKDKVDIWEAFSNSPPWFQTVSGYVSGGFNGATDQIRADRVDEFATYLVRVTEHIEKAHGIRFDTIDPLNEPNTPYWSTTLGADGQPTGGRQEGAHAGPELQAKVIQALQRALADAKTTAVISAPDETNPTIFAADWAGYPADVRAAVDQLNVHTYGTGQRTTARDIAKAADKPLWMSEVEGTYVTGTTDYTSMLPGLGMATHIVDDIRELEPSAWVLWQPIEDGVPQQAAGKNWGSIHVPFTCTASDTLATCPIQTNTKFDTLRNFTHYIGAGDKFVKVDDRSSVAAIRKSGRGATVVHVNRETAPRSVTLDLSGFADIRANARVTPVVTSADAKLATGNPVPVTGKSVTLTVPAQSVTTFLVDGVSSVADDAALIQPRHTYRLESVQSGKSLAPSEDGASAIIRTSDPARADQLWSVRKIGSGVSNRDRYVISNAATGRRLAVRNGATVLETAGRADEAAQWIMSTTGDGTYTFINVAAQALLDVTGRATADGSKVATAAPTSATNQRWTVLDETPVRAEPVKVATVPGVAPVMPDTVTVTYHSGARRALPVTWDLPAEDQWSSHGKVTVRGVAVDLLQRQIKTRADVVVDTYVRTVPGSARTYVGGQLDLPPTVVGVGRHGGRVDLPVTWDPVPAGAFDEVGVVTLHGVAQVPGGGRLDAAVRVEVTEPIEVNLAPDPGVSVAATYTEGGYSAEALRNGVTAEKAWSNWKSGTKNPSETITFALPGARDVTGVVTHFYRDSTAGGGLAQSVAVQVRRADGSCASAGDPVPVGTTGAPVVDVPVTAAGPATGVCVVLTAVPNGYLTLGEIQVFVKAPRPA